MTKQSVRILVIEARYYDKIADALLDGARRAIAAAGAECEVITVPGALEIPAAIAMANSTGHHAGPTFDAFVALGCVIRGETSHYDIVANESARGLMDLSISQRLAIGNGILTVENEDQAWARLDASRVEHKGENAAKAAIAMVQVRRQVNLGFR